MNHRFRSWLASIPTFLAVVAVFILGGTALVFVAKGVDALSGQYKCAFFTLALYVVCFALYEINAREQARRHFQMGEMRVQGWVKRFKDTTPSTDNNILKALYEEGVALRDEYGDIILHDYRKDLEVLAGLLKPDQ